MKEKLLMTSFFVGNFADVAVTFTALSVGEFEEKGVLASDLFAKGEQEEMLILKFGVTALMIGIYALTKQTNSRWEFSAEKSLEIGNAIVWGAVALNSLQLAPVVINILTH